MARKYFFFFLAPLIFTCAVFATPNPSDVDLILNIGTALEIRLPSSSVDLELTPTSTVASFTQEDFIVQVSTNNIAGYTLGLSTDNTNLTSTTEATVPALDPLSDGYTQNTFTTNHWGFKYNTPNFFPISQEEVIATTNQATLQDSHALTFAAKIDIHQPAGTYQTTLNFTAVANYIQAPAPTTFNDVTLANCQEFATDDHLTIYDTRQYAGYPEGEFADYTIRYIDGYCWMTQNLRIPKSTILTPADSNIASNYTIPTADILLYGTQANNTYGQATDTGDALLGYYYNLCAASAGDACTASEEYFRDLNYDICPKGWSLPGVAPAVAITSNSGNRQKFNLAEDTQSWMSTRAPSISRAPDDARVRYGTITYFGNAYSHILEIRSNSTQPGVEAFARCVLKDN